MAFLLKKKTEKIKTISYSLIFNTSLSFN